MAKFTQDPNEIMHIQHINGALWSTAVRNKGQVKVVLNDGSSIVGRIAGQASGNNAGKGGFWAYYGEVTIEDANGKQHAIDCLDVDYVTKP